jgi:hypothetical protein
VIPSLLSLFSLALLVADVRDCGSSYTGLVPCALKLGQHLLNHAGLKFLESSYLRF